jgi:hypothetical protein
MARIGARDLGLQDETGHLIALNAGREDVLAFIMEEVDDVQVGIVAHGFRRDIDVHSTSHNDPVDAHGRLVLTNGAGVEQAPRKQLKACRSVENTTLSCAQRDFDGTGDILDIAMQVKVPSQKKLKAGVGNKSAPVADLSGIATNFFLPENNVY